MWSLRRPTLELDNSPESLVQISMRKIIVDQISFSHVSLPPELYHLLMQVYRDEHLSGSNVAECSKFITQFYGQNLHRLSHLDISGLPVTDYDLAPLFHQHSRYLNSLDLSDCPELTHHTLQNWADSLLNVTDINKMCRTITLINADSGRIESTFFHKNDYNQLKWGIKCVSKSNSSDNSHETCEKMDDIAELFDQASLHENPAMHRLYLDFREENVFFDPCFSDLRASTVIDGDKTLSLQHTQSWRVHRHKESPELVGAYLTIKTWQTSCLTSLNLGDYRRLTLRPDNPFADNHGDKVLLCQLFAICPNLKRLIIHNFIIKVDEIFSMAPCISLAFEHKLEYLDLSGCKSIGSGQWLLNLRNLKTLILYNVPELDLAVISIAKVSTLRYLDISASRDSYGHGYKHPEDQLSLISLGLPNLTHLDISGTNLAGPLCDHIAGLSNRYTKPLEFLGLYLTSNEAAYRANIPALRVAGDADDEQILTACEEYINRYYMLKKTLNDLFQCFRVENHFKDLNRALDVVLLAMRKHLNEKQIQITATASLFYIVKLEDTTAPFTPKIRRIIIKALLDAMHKHRNDITMLRNASLTLVHFKIPQDVLFEYPRLVEILLFIVSKDEDEFVQRLGVYLLNTLACQVEGEQKLLVGDLGAISKMLALIASKLSRGLCDEVMETAWSTMWNVTDETPVNCQRFLDNRGMEYFMQCVEKFPSKPELLRNMMGLLGNVAECPDLRKKLMKQDYIDCFADMLSSTTHGIEISYNAAGILAHIVSDGEQVWYDHLPTTDRSVVLEKLSRAIGSWQINSKRNINYRSFEPILRLLSPQVTNHEAQYWAIFALVNLTRVHSEKYCDLFINDGGVEIVNKLLQKPDLPSCIILYARLTLYQVERFKKYGGLGSLEHSDSLALTEMVEEMME